MATRRHDQIIETPTEARQAEPGPSVLLLTVQAVWKRFSSPKNCKQPGAMDLDATV